MNAGVQNGLSYEKSDCKVMYTVDTHNGKMVWLIDYMYMMREQVTLIANLYIATLK